MIDISRALAVQGLMQPYDLTQLATFASTHSKILELGSYFGRSTRALADNTEGFVVACDNFEGPKDLVLTWKERQQVFGKFSTNLADHIASGKVLPWQAQHASLDFSQSPKPPKYDMVFIDGSHVREEVARDIQTGLSVLEKGGLICGHDYDMGSPGVVMACYENVPGFEVAQGTRIWWKVID